MKRLLRIDLTKRQFRYEDVPSKYANLGGRGLTSKIVSEEVPATSEPLGEKNKLIFAPGILAGTAMPNSGRLSVGAKSPLTNTIKEANAGGQVGHKLSRLGIHAVIVEGASSQMLLAKISQTRVEFFPADELKGKGNYEIADELRKRFGDDVAIASIGLAGEFKLKAASVATTTPDFKIRVAARGGLGAVMGSKGLKALVIDDVGGPGVMAKDPEKLKECARQFSKVLLTHPLVEGFKQLGTPVLVNMINAAGCLPTKNYSAGQFEGAEKISGENMVGIMAGRPNGQPQHRCMTGCIISCSNVYVDEQGQEIVSGLEYETLALTGSNCMIDNLDDIARINRLCNDIGIDTMDVGAAIAIAMEAGLLPWGDGKAACAIIEEVRTGTEKGRMIGNGCYTAGLALNAKRIPAVKGQSLAGYDPRVLKGTGVTYATSPMGADHTSGLVLPSPAMPDYNPAAPSGQAPVSAFVQTYIAAIDSLGLCIFAGLPALEMPELLPHLIASASAVTGEQVDENYLSALGASVLAIEKHFNQAAGFSAKDDRLPEFFTTEALPPSGLMFDVAEAEVDSTLAFQ